MRPYEMLMATITLSLFYSVGVTLLAHSLAPMVTQGEAQMVARYATHAKDLNEFQALVNTNLSKQFDIPIVDLGALVFYSGNLVADLMYNFFFALPSLATLVVHTIFVFIPADRFVVEAVKVFVGAFVAITMMLTILAFILSVRSRGSLI